MTSFPSKVWRRLNGSNLLSTVALLALIAIVIQFSWIGFLASDDAIYLSGGRGWINEFPFVGGHGSIRHTLTIPIALSILVFGEGEIPLILPTLLYFSIIIVATYLFLKDLFGANSAFVVSASLILIPLIAATATTASADIGELFFILLSLVCFWRATEGKNATRNLLLAGCAASFAFITRETTVFLLGFYGVLFGIGWGIRRIQYWWMAAGFLAVWSLEVLYLYLLKGDPFYRVNISLHHGDGKIDRATDQIGNIAIHPIVDPILLPLFNQEFGILFWLAIPLAIFTLIAKRLQLPRLFDEKQEKFLVLISGLCLFWIVCVGAAVTLLPLNPRYLMVSAFLGGIITVIYLWKLLLIPSKRNFSIVAMFLITLSYSASIYVENKETMFGESALAEYSMLSPEVIFTDEFTATRAEDILIWRGDASKVNTNVARKGALFFCNLPRLKREARRGKISSIVPTECSEHHGTVVWSSAPNPKLAGRVIKALGFEELVPESLWDNLYQQHPGVTVYRIAKDVQESKPPN